MNRRTRLVSLGLLAVLVGLLALGALPSTLQSGDAYHVTATVEAEWTGADSTAVPGARTALNASVLSSDRYPYTTAALADVGNGSTGRSDPYWRGPVGFKEAFTHSPFDELNGIEEQHPDVAAADGVYVHDGNRLYRVRITHDD